MKKLICLLTALLLLCSCGGDDPYEPKKGDEFQCDSLKVIIDDSPPINGGEIEF